MNLEHNQTPFNSEVSLFSGVGATLKGKATIKTILADIQGEKFKNKILGLRKIKATDPEKYKESKKTLTSTTLAGYFSYRNSKSLVKPSGFFHGDIDHVQNLPRVKEKICGDPYTAFCFVSPGGDGLKFGIKINPEKLDNKRYHAYFQAIQKYFQEKHSVSLDEERKDISGLCFMSYDPELFINLNSEIFPEPKGEPRQAPKTMGKLTSNNLSATEKYCRAALEKACEAIRQAREGTRNGTLNDQAFGIGQIVGEGELTYQVAESALLAAGLACGLSEHEVRATIKSGLEAGMKQPRDLSEIGKKSEKKLSTEQNPDSFWYEGTDQKGKPTLHIDAKQLLDFLEKNGFCKRYVDDQQSILLRIADNTIEETTPEKAADFAHKYILSLPNQITANFQQYDLIKKCFSPNFPYFTEKQLKKFLPTELTFHRDDKDRAFFYFKNRVVEISKDGRVLKQYPEIKGTIWKRWVLNRNYVVPTNQDEPGDFEKFIQLICKGDKKRIMALMTAIGYLIHRYKNPALTKAIILVDEKISEIPEGRSGKSLLAKALGKFRNLTTVDGKDFDFDSRFAFQDVSFDTELICFDDVKRNFDFERLFHKITDGLEVERKGQHRFKIAREDSAKFIITTNFMVMGEGGSSEGRRAEYELHPHFTREHTPKDEFGKLFFDEWDIEEWARFDAFMLDCVQLFLAKGLLTADPVNIARRKIIQATCPEFLSWADKFFKDEAGNLKESVMVWHSKKALFGSFLDSSEDHKTEVEKGKFKRNTFTKWLSSYCLQSKIKIEDKDQWVVGKSEGGFGFSKIVVHGKGA